MDIIQNVRGRKIQYVKLNPIDSNTEIDYVLLGIDIYTNHIYNLIEIGSNGTKTTLTVSIHLKPTNHCLRPYFRLMQSKYSDYFINNLD